MARCSNSTCWTFYPDWFLNQELRSDYVEKCFLFPTPTWNFFIIRPLKIISPEKCLLSWNETKTTKKCKSQFQTFFSSDLWNQLKVSGVKNGRKFFSFEAENRRRTFRRKNLMKFAWKKLKLFSCFFLLGNCLTTSIFQLKLMWFGWGRDNLEFTRKSWQRLNNRVNFPHFAFLRVFFALTIYFGWKSFFNLTRLVPHNVQSSVALWNWKTSSTVIKEAFEQHKNLITTLNVFMFIILRKTPHPGPFVVRLLNEISNNFLSKQIFMVES